MSNNDVYDIELSVMKNISNKGTTDDLDIKCQPCTACNFNQNGEQTITTQPTQMQSNVQQKEKCKQQPPCLAQSQQEDVTDIMTDILVDRLIVYDAISSSQHQNWYEQYVLN